MAGMGPCRGGGKWCVWAVLAAHDGPGAMGPAGRIKTGGLTTPEITPRLPSSWADLGRFDWVGGCHGRRGSKHPHWRIASLNGNITSQHMNVLTYCVAAGLCTETQDEEVAAGQLAESIRALEAQVLKAEGELAAVQARESARLDDRLAEIRRRHPFLSVERCAAILEYEESVA